MRVGPVCVCVAVVLALCACANGGGGSSTAPLPTAIAVIDDSAPAPGGPLHVVFYPRIGSQLDDQWGAVGPGVVLMNGGLEPTSAFPWMHDTVDRDRIAGDVVVLCTQGDDVYSSAVYAAAPFNSVQTVLVPREAPGSDIDLVATRLATAEIVFLTDGDLSVYAGWVRTSLADALTGVYDRGGVVAGSGAGAAALGWSVLTTKTDSATALANPYDPSITLKNGPFALPLMTGTYVDLDLESNDRFGVLAAMTARGVAAGLTGIVGTPPLGVGLDVNAALAIDRQGIITLLGSDGASGAAWIVHGGAVGQIAPGEPLLWPAAQVTRFDTASESLTIAANCGTAFSYDVAIDGKAAAPFTPADPYEAQGTANPCTL
jgi:cyanophycinase-like exopeptidase